MGKGRIKTDRAMAHGDIIFDDDLAPVGELGPQWKAVIAVVTRITTPTTSATGFFVAPDRVITNHHVIPTLEALRHAAVRRGFVGGSEGHRVQVDAGAFFHTSAELDYTIFSVAPVAGIEPLSLDAAVEPALGDEVYVIGHPNGRTMSFARRDCPVVAIEPPHVEYRADTLAGHSGAPVLLASTCALVALHHFGDDDLDNSNRGVLATFIATDLRND